MLNKIYTGKSQEDILDKIMGLLKNNNVYIDTIKFQEKKNGIFEASCVYYSK